MFPVHQSSFYQNITEVLSFLCVFLKHNRNTICDRSNCHPVASILALGLDVLFVFFQIVG